MRKTIITLAAAAGLSVAGVGALNAQGNAPGAIDVSAVEAGSYTVDPSHSMVVWSVSHLGFNDYYGIFGDVEGTLELNTEDVSTSALEVTIPIASVTVPSSGLLDHLLRPGQDGGAPDFFGPDPEPARFISTSIVRTGDTTADITGNLTLNGVTNEVTLDAEMSGMGTNGMNQKETIGFHGSTTINRSEFDIAWGIPFGISDEVDLEITIAFEM